MCGVAPWLALNSGRLRIDVVQRTKSLSFNTKPD